MLAISVSAFRNLEILGLEVKNVLCILIVLVLGWKQGILIGGTSGITIRCSTWSGLWKFSEF